MNDAHMYRKPSWVKQFNILSVLLSDSYKQFHPFMYPEGLLLLYSNLTPRSFKFAGTDYAVWFGMNYYAKEYLIRQWTEYFFRRPKEEVIKEYKRFHKHFSGVEDMDTTHIEELWDLGYLPIVIKALPEGAKVGVKVPPYTIRNTVDGFGWLTNFLETQMSNVMWDLMVIATKGYQYRKILDKWALKTTGSTDGVQWQGHDFSMRGRSSVESSCNQAAWLMSFTGTDTIPAVLMLEHYYNVDISTTLVGASVPATEHSVATSFGSENEIDSFIRVLKQFPTGVVSMVADSYDYWDVIVNKSLELKPMILARGEGTNVPVNKVVFRPDSGNPVRIIAGYRESEIARVNGKIYELNADGTTGIELQEHEVKGTVQMLWDNFGGTVTAQGYKLINPKVGVIYGDSITLEIAEEICARLAEKGFASLNVVFGIGSFTMNYNTRDTLGIAVKSTYCELEKTYSDNDVSEILSEEIGYKDHGQDLSDKAYDFGFKWNAKKLYWTRDSDERIQREIFKDPKTDSGLKKSAKGLLRVDLIYGEYVLKDQCTWEEEAGGELKEVFRDGQLLIDPCVTEIRERLYPNVQTA